MPFLSPELIPIFSQCACAYLIETHIPSHGHGAFCLHENYGVFFIGSTNLGVGHRFLSHTEKEVNSEEIGMNSGKESRINTHT